MSSLKRNGHKKLIQGIDLHNGHCFSIIDNVRDDVLDHDLNIRLVYGQNANDYE